MAEQMYCPSSDVLIGLKLIVVFVVCPDVSRLLSIISSVGTICWLLESVQTTLRDPVKPSLKVTLQVRLKLKPAMGGSIMFSEVVIELAGTVK